MGWAKHGWNRDPGITVCCKAAVKVSRWRSRQIRSHTGIVQNWKSKKVGEKRPEEKKESVTSSNLKTFFIVYVSIIKISTFWWYKIGIYFFFLLTFGCAPLAAESTWSLTQFHFGHKIQKELKYTKLLLWKKYDHIKHFESVSCNILLIVFFFFRQQLRADGTSWLHRSIVAVGATGKQ